MNIRAKKIRITFDNSSEDNWEATCEGGIEFDDAMRMIARAWKEYDEPKEPLIKNRNIRDAIRAWAKSNLVERVKFEYVNGTGSVFAYSDVGVKIIFRGDLRLTNRMTYEIDDLCGEEEE